MHVEQTLDRNVSIRMPEDLAAVIDKLAEEDQRTFSQMARILLEKGIRQHTRYVIPTTKKAQ